MVDKNSRAYKYGFWASFNLMRVADSIADTAVDAVSGTVDVIDNASSGLVDGVVEYNKLSEAKVAAKAATNAAAALNPAP